jgi:CheY-like chemotaxis protein/two-component sensor histidine kinase
MSVLLDDLLDIARITHGKLQLRKESVLLTHVVNAASEAVRSQLNSKHQHLSVELPTVAVQLGADPVRLAQILTNLLTNASRYSETGSRIDLTSSIEGKTLVLSVRDDGIGISPDAIAGIFEMFSQINAVDARSAGGLGIGLALVKGLAELHGGSVEAHSAGLGRGSEFIVRLPIDALDPAGPAIRDTAQSKSPGRRILLADDNRDAADSLAVLLKLAGHEVRVAYLGRDALALAMEFRPDTAVLDIGMPDLDGYELLPRLRTALRAEPADLPAIALTGFAAPADSTRAVRAGFQAHVAKPFDVEALYRLVARLAPPHLK